MAFNFTPLEYNPFKYENKQGLAPKYDQYDGTWSNVPAQQATHAQVQDWQRQGIQDQMNQQQTYSGNQFQSLFDSVNDIGINPLVSGEAYNNAPVYSPYGGTRAQFTTGTQPGYTNNYGGERDGMWEDPDGPTLFDQKSYLDARFGNINDYLGKMGSFFGNMGSGQDAQTQAMLANMQGQGPRPVMPSVGMGSSFNPSAGGTGGTSGNNPFQSFGALQSGGWGTAPTSLFGAGAGNANNT